MVILMFLMFLWAFCVFLLWLPRMFPLIQSVAYLMLDNVHIVYNRTMSRVLKLDNPLMSVTMVCNLKQPDMNLVYKLKVSNFVTKHSKATWDQVVKNIVHEMGGCGGVLLETRKVLFITYKHPVGGRTYVRACTTDDQLASDIPVHQMRYVDKVFSINCDDCQNVLLLFNQFAGPNYDFHNTSCTLRDFLFFCRLNGVPGATIDNFFVNGMSVTTRVGKILRFDKDDQIATIVSANTHGNFSAKNTNSDGDSTSTCN